MFTQENLQRSLADVGVAMTAPLFSQLCQAYTEPGRHYHTDRHVAVCLAQFRRVAHLAEHPAETEIALWFHDAVYDTHRSDNEEKSAEWAHTYLSEGGADSAVAARVADMIIATKTHDAYANDACLLVDIDLGVLGASEQAFEAYDREIRQEYDWVPEEQYRAGRVRVLMAFQGKEFIYKTAGFRKRYEEQARRNLARKIKELCS